MNGRRNARALPRAFEEPSPRQELTDEDLDAMLTPAQAAQLLHCSRDTLYRRVARGRLRCVRNGSRLLFSRSDLRRFLEGGGRR